MLPFERGDKVKVSRLKMLGVPICHYSVKASGNERDFLNQKLNEETGKYEKLIHVLADPKFLKLHYEGKGRGEGYMTRAVDEETVDAINNEWFEKTARSLKAGNFT